MKLNATTRQLSIFFFFYCFIDSSYSQAPNQPVNPVPVNQATTVSINPNLCATVSDPNGGTLQVRYYGRLVPPNGSEKFTIILLPDTQYYTEEPQGNHDGGNVAMFNAQTAWIANNRLSRNIVYVGQLGDCVQNGDDPPGSNNEIEWQRAQTAIATIENPTLTGLPQGIPFGISVGNHDQTPIATATGTTTYYNQYFGSGHFAGRTYYGGHYGSNNDNHYQLFTASGIDFLVISLEYDQSAAFSAAGGPLDWTENLVLNNPNRKVIVMTHWAINENASFSTQGQAIYNRLRIYPNFSFLLGGHVSSSTGGEAQRTDIYNGNRVHTILTDYQSRPAGGNGLLRIYEFDPSLNKVSVKTFSPYTNTFETDANSQFELPFNMLPMLGQTNTIASGTSACLPWSNLSFSSNYEWDMELYDGQNVTLGPLWKFTTAGTDLTPPIVSSVSPLNGATGLSVSTTASAIFNESIDAATINSSTLELRNASNSLIATTVSFNAGSRTATVTPTGALANSTVYTVTIKGGASGVKDVAGNALANDYSWSFTTIAGDITPPTISSVNPANGTAGVSVSTTASAVFNESMDATTINSSTLELRNASNVLIATTVSFNAGSRTATVTPLAALANSTAYTVTIKGGASGVKDVAGNALANDYSWSFTTIAGDITPPTISSVNPANGTTGVSVSTTASVIFNESMDATTINSSTIELRNASNVLIATTVSFNAGSRTATVTPSAALANSTAYTVTIKGGASGVKDVAGNALANDYSWSFTTIAGDITPPTISSVNPANGTTGVSVSTTASVIFNESMDATTINSSTIELRNAANVLIATTVSFNAGSRTATVTPSAALANSTAYTVTIKAGASGVKDVSGNPLAGNYSWSFTTVVVTSQPLASIQSFNTKTGASATTHALTGVPAGALLVLSTTADAAPSNCNVSSSPSLTWTKRVDAAASSSDNAEIWTAVYSAGGSITVTSNWGTESQASVCYVVLNAETPLAGASATGVLQSAPSVTLSTTRDNSIIFGCTADWKAINGTTRTLRDAAADRLYFRDGNYTTYHYTKTTASIAAYTEGLSLPTGQQASTALLEIRGVSGAADITPPTISAVTPLNGTTGVLVTATASAVFNEAMDATTINSSTIELRNASNTLITATISYNAGTRTATITPVVALANSAVYTAKLKGGTSGVKDVAGNSLAIDYSWSFTTGAGDITPPAISSVTPANGATGVSVNTTASAIFNESMNAATINSSTIELRNSSNSLLTATISYNTGTRTATITPSALLVNSTVYTVKIISGSSGVKDVAGNALTNDYSWSFTTAAGDITPPTVSSVSPANGATGVPVSATPSAIFNEAMNAGTVNSSTIELRNPSNTLVPSAISYNAGTRTVTITPSAALANSGVYTATVKSGTSGVKDASGNALASDYNWSFTTVAATSQPPVSIQSVNTKTGTAATVHPLTGVPAGALLVLATTCDAVPSNCGVSSSPSLTWTKRADAGATSSDNAEIWTAVYTSGGSITVTSNWGATSQASVCYVVLNAEPSIGGASAIATLQSAPSVTIATTRANSIIFGCTADWKAIDGSTRTLRDAATERLYFKDGNYTTYHYTKTAAATAGYTEGVSLPTGQQASTALLEIRSASTAAARPAHPSITTSNSNVRSYSLGQNYPNPFNSGTNIPFTLSKAQKVNLVLYDINGRVVKVLVKDSKDAGAHAVNFNAGSLAKGVYYYRIQAGDFTDVKKLIIW